MRKDRNLLAISHFTSKESNVSKYHSIHKHLEQVYATDNYVLATCHSAYLPEWTKETVTELEWLSEIRKIIEWRKPNVSKTIGLDELRRVLKMVPKEKKKILDRECAKCEWDGWLECDMGHEHECPECGWDGYFYKKWESTEQMAEYSAMKIGDAFLSPQYVEKLVTVCEILGKESVRHIYDMEGDDWFVSAQEFRIGDVRITIMPLREKRWWTIAWYEIFDVNYENHGTQVTSKENPQTEAKNDSWIASKETMNCK